MERKKRKREWRYDNTLYVNKSVLVKGNFTLVTKCPWFGGASYIYYTQIYEI